MLNQLVSFCTSNQFIADINFLFRFLISAEFSTPLGNALRTSVASWAYMGKGNWEWASVNLKCLMKIFEHETLDLTTYISTQPQAINIGLPDKVVTTVEFLRWDILPTLYSQIIRYLFPEFWNEIWIYSSSQRTLFRRSRIKQGLLNSYQTFISIRNLYYKRIP